MVKALFLDRDGVINVDYGYVGSVADVTFCDGIFELVKTAYDNDIKIFIVTNQSGIGRGYYSEKDFMEVMGYILGIFQDFGCPVLDYRWCPHLPSEFCACRKPQPSMVLDLAKTYNLNLVQSAMIGDSVSDVQCGINAGIRNTFLIKQLDRPDDPKRFHISDYFSSIRELLDSREWVNYLRNSTD